MKRKSKQILKKIPSLPYGSRRSEVWKSEEHQRIGIGGSIEKGIRDELFIYYITDGVHNIFTIQDLEKLSTATLSSSVALFTVFTSYI